MRAAGIDQWDEHYPARSDFEADWRSGSLYLCQLGERLVGCAVLNAEADPGYADVPWGLHDAPIGIIHRLVIDPSWQGRGLATGVMRQLEERARAIGFRTLRLDAFSRNPGAVRLYEKLGYRRAGPIRFRKGWFHCFEKALGNRTAGRS